MTITPICFCSGETWTYYGSSDDKNDTIASGSGCEDEDDEDCAETSGTISGDKGKC